MITSRVVLRLRALTLISLEKEPTTGSDINAHGKITRLEFAVKRSITTGTRTDTDIESGHAPCQSTPTIEIVSREPQDRIDSGCWAWKLKDVEQNELHRTHHDILGIDVEDKVSWGQSVPTMAETRQKAAAIAHAHQPVDSFPKAVENEHPGRSKSRKEDISLNTRRTV
jgi:hypothetical protein